MLLIICRPPKEKQTAALWKLHVSRDQFFKMS